MEILSYKMIYESYMNQITFINTVISLYATLLFVVIHPGTFFTIQIRSNIYYASIIIHTFLYFILYYLTEPIMYSLFDHRPHHPDP